MLGTNGSTVVQIATEVSGQSRGVKIRIRGIGSGFFEMFNQELQEPLHFNVSAENEEFLAQAAGKVRELVARVKVELESQPHSQSQSFKGHSGGGGGGHGHGQQQLSTQMPSFGGPQALGQGFPMFGQQQQQFSPVPSFAPHAPPRGALPPPPPN